MQDTDTEAVRRPDLRNTSARRLHRMIGTSAFIGSPHSRDRRSRQNGRCSANAGPGRRSHHIMHTKQSFESTLVCTSAEACAADRRSVWPTGCGPTIDSCFWPQHEGNNGAKKDASLFTRNARLRQLARLVALKADACTRTNHTSMAISYVRPKA